MAKHKDHDMQDLALRPRPHDGSPERDRDEAEDSAAPSPDRKEERTGKRERQPAYPAPYPTPYGGTPYYGGYYGGYYGADPHAGGSTLAWTFRLLKRKWKTIAFMTAMGLVTAAFIIATATPIYKAEALLEMSVRRPRVMDRNDAVVMQDTYYSYNSEDVFNTRLEKFRSPETVQVAERFLPDQVGTSKLDIAAAEFELIPDSFLVKISCRHTDPEWATICADAYAKAMIEAMAKENREMSDSAVKWLEAQAAAQKAELDKTERALADFRTTHKLDRLANRKEAAEQALRDLNERLTALQGETILAKEIVSVLKEVKLPDNMPGTEEIREKMTNLRKAQTEHQTLLTKYRAAHPKVIVSSKQVKLLEGDVKEAIRKALRTAQSNLALLRSQTAGLQAGVDEKRKEAEDIESQIVQRQSELAMLEREQAVANMSYQGILNRMEEARLSADEKTAAIKVTREAEFPEGPVYPRKFRIAFMCLFLGACLGFGAGWVQNLLEDYISSSDDVEYGLKLKPLGIIPRQDVDSRRDLAGAVLSGDHLAITEAFAGIRTALSIGSSAEASESLLITSAGVECGKTIVACNLAVTYARADRRTLLVDLDLRRPRVAGIFGVRTNHQISLTHALAEKSLDEKRFEGLVLPTDCRNLSLVVSRADKEISPSSLIAGPSLARFIEWAKENYDQVVLDSPPYGLLSDAAVFAAHVGGVVIVCRHEKSHKRAVRHTIRRLQHVDANILGAIVNGAPMGEGLFSSYDYYYGSYYHKEYETAPEAAE